MKISTPDHTAAINDAREKIFDAVEILTREGAPELLVDRLRAIVDSKNRYELSLKNCSFLGAKK